MVGLFRGMVFCLVLATVGVAGSSQTKPSSPLEQRVAKQDARLGADKSETTGKEPSNPPNVTGVVKQENPSSHKPDENKDDENIAIQRKLANFTWRLVIVGCIQAAILALTVWAIIGQTRTTKNTERAWVMVDVAHDAAKWAGQKNEKVRMLEGSGNSGDSTAFYAVLTCRNEGKSPAWVYERRAKFEITSSPLPLKPNFDSAESVEVEPTPLGTGQALPHTDQLEWPAQARGHIQQGQMAVVYGIVKYRDIFDNRRQTTFGYRITPSNELRRLEGEHYREYNKNA
jgi:hypothetical protein